MNNFIYQLINGLNLGSIFALIALGYNMVYGIVKLINFAHGDIIMVGAYVALFSLTMAGMPLWAAVLCSMAFCAATGMLIERVAYRRLRVKNAPRISLLITAIGVSIFLQNLAQLLFGSSGRSFPNMITAEPIAFGDKTISVTTIVTIVTTLVIMVLLQLLVNKSKIGKGHGAPSPRMRSGQAHGYQHQRDHLCHIRHRLGPGGGGSGALQHHLSQRYALYGLPAGP